MKKHLKINYGFKTYNNKMVARPKRNKSVSYFKFSSHMRDIFGGDSQTKGNMSKMEKLKRKK